MRILIAVLALFCASASARTLSVEQFFRQSDFSNVQLSPDATSLAAFAPINGRRNLVVIDLATRKPFAVTSFKNEEVTWYRWINNRRLVFTVVKKSQRDGQRTAVSPFFGEPAFFASDKDGGRPRDMRSVRFLQAVSAMGGPAEAQSDDVLAVSREFAFTTVVRLNTVNERMTRVVDRAPGRNPTFLLDRTGRVRASMTYDEFSFQWAGWLRDDDKDPWKKIVEGHQFDTTDWRSGFNLVTFDYAGELIVTAWNDQGRKALYYWDSAKNALGLEIASHPRVDVTGGLIFDSVKRSLVGIRINAERPEYHWVDDDWARWHGMLSRALAGKDVSLSRSGTSSLLVVHASSDRDPGTYYLFDTQGGKLEELVRERPWISEQKMGERRPIRYRARDGLEIPAYLTLPPGREPKGLPLIVLVHGGPYVRGEFWTFDEEAQFLASRGYAVLQADFRGSTGYGVAHYKAGWRQWGGTMQDDLNDGVTHLAGLGIVDAKRACVMGASYGGYSALMGVARDPGFWRCAVSYAGVSDLIEMATSAYDDQSELRSRDPWMRQRVGDPVKDRETLEKLSPVFHANRIKEPVFLAIGTDDYRVPMEHGTRMRSALARHNAPHEWMLYEWEIHGFSKDDHEIDFYGRVEKFLAKHLPPAVP